METDRIKKQGEGHPHGMGGDNAGEHGQVCLNELDPDDVQVELYTDGQDFHGVFPLC
jgi:hypothetical protein